MSPHAALLADPSVPPLAVCQGRGTGAASDVGHVRPHNEDAWRIDHATGVMVLADGMGGYQAGEVASAMAVAAVIDALPDALTLGLAAPAAEEVAFEPGDASAGLGDRLGDLVPAHAAASSAAPLSDPAFAALVRAVELANQSVISAARQRPECLGMGTTVVVAWVRGDRLLVAHVGDSRAYRWRCGRLTRLTRDHSIGQAMIDAGLLREGAASIPAMRGVLTRALGVDPGLCVDARSVDLDPGDRILLCSDGLTDMLDDATIAECLGQPGSAQDLAEALVVQALLQGGIDNITALVLGPLPPGSHGGG
jgi:serine/threonine protein phosphatase PrpC